MSITKGSKRKSRKAQEQKVSSAPTPVPKQVAHTNAPTSKTAITIQQQVTTKPTSKPIKTKNPTKVPIPTNAPITKLPTKSPIKITLAPTPTNNPTATPTKKPSPSPTKKPSTQAPTKKPTPAPTTEAPTQTPTRQPTAVAVTSTSNGGSNSDTKTASPSFSAQNRAADPSAVNRLSQNAQESQLATEKFVFYGVAGVAVAVVTVLVLGLLMKRARARSLKMRQETPKRLADAPSTSSPTTIQWPSIDWSPSIQNEPNIRSEKDDVVEASIVAFRQGLSCDASLANEEFSYADTNMSEIDDDFSIAAHGSFSTGGLYHVSVQKKASGRSVKF